jgi:hypothetical protein
VFGQICRKINQGAANIGDDQIRACFLDEGLATVTSQRPDFIGHVIKREMPVGDMDGLDHSPARISGKT